MTFFDGGQPDVTIGELWETQRRTMSSIGDIESIVNRLKNGQGFYGNAIQSTNYVAGVSGWKIDFTGVVEFSSGIFRGAISVGTSPRVEIQSLAGVGTIRFPTDNVNEGQVSTLSASAGGDVTFNNGTWVGGNFSSGSLTFSRSTATTTLTLNGLLSGMAHSMSLPGGTPLHQVLTRYGSVSVAEHAQTLDGGTNGVLTEQIRDSNLGSVRARLHATTSEIRLDKYLMGASNPLKSFINLADSLIEIRNIKATGVGPDQTARFTVNNYATLTADLFDSSLNRVRYLEMTPTQSAFVTTNAAQSGLTVQNLATAASTWNLSTVVAASSADPSFASYSAFAPYPFAGIAPIWGAYNPSGEVWQALNNPNTAHIPIWAAAFVVISTRKSKTDIVEMSDDELFDRLARTPAVVTYRNKVRPQNVVPTERFNRINAEWVARGHQPLTVPRSEMTSADHDCTLGHCPDPCPIAINDEPDLGVLAEDWGEVWPEIVHVSPDGTDGAVDYARLAPVALRAAALLARRLHALENDSR